ncbi:MAG: VCBS repeat-containing protein [Acidobacteria bacterium]|nr:VCBS repeat-containing protein [Acidobacteriota bacterium]
MRLPVPAMLVLICCIAVLRALPPVASFRSFDRALLLEDKGETSAGASIGDVNGDGHPDILLAKGRHWPLHNRVLLNDSKGSFRASDVSDAPDRTYTAALADVDGDRTLDLVVSNDKPDRKLVYRNDGKGRFQVTGTFGDPNWSTRYVTLADLNGDKYPDIIAANRSGSAKATPSYVCLNNRKGAFPACTPLATESATIIVAADFDGDGAIDLCVPHRDGGRSVVLWNDGKGMFATSTAYGPEKSQIRAAAAGDLDGDGRPDLVMGEERGGVSMYRNNGGRAFAAPVALQQDKAAVYSIAIADMNRDRKPDIIVGKVRSPGSVLFNDGAGKAFQEVKWNDGKGAVYGVAIADLDGDGWPDIVAARSDAPNAIWFSTEGKLK